MPNHVPYVCMHTRTQLRSMCVPPTKNALTKSKSTCFSGTDKGVENSSCRLIETRDIYQNSTFNELSAEIRPLHPESVCTSTSVVTRSTSKLQALNKVI